MKPYANRGNLEDLEGTEKSMEVSGIVSWLGCGWLEPGEGVSGQNSQTPTVGMDNA